MDRQWLQSLLRQCWSLETSTKWTPDAPATGQCPVTALVVQDHFGGDIVKTRVGDAWHFYNVIDGERLDLTEEQFAAPIHYSDTPSSRGDAFSDATQEQYENLSARLRALMTGTGGQPR